MGATALPPEAGAGTMAPPINFYKFVKSVRIIRVQFVGSHYKRNFLSHLRLTIAITHPFPVSASRALPIIVPGITLAANIASPATAEVVS